MTAQTLYEEAGRRGLRLWAEGDTLVVVPRSKCPPDFVDTLRQHKSELLDWLKARADGLKLDEAPWLHLAKQVLLGEWDGCDGSTRDSLVIGLRSIQHPACRAALARLGSAEKEAQ
jgi:hypothetical protein